MDHYWTCVTCGKRFRSDCWEDLDFTEAGKETRHRQLDESKCNECFGEVPELRMQKETK